MCDDEVKSELRMVGKAFIELAKAPCIRRRLVEDLAGLEDYIRFLKRKVAERD